MSTVQLCELPPQQPTRAVLSPNTARNHHYISQTEQRQFAFNPDVNANNQNVYRLNKTDLHHAKAAAQSVNIDHNLSSQNLYTLAELRDGQQYNMENWFVRYEGRFEQDCDVVKRLPLGKQAMPEEMVRILKLKWLSVLRNPLNHQHFIVRHLSQLWQQGLTQAAQALQPHLLERDDEARHKLAKQFGLTDGAYVSWLSFLYALLSDAVAAPSWFERLCQLLVTDPNVTVEYLQDADSAVVFADTGFALQASPACISIGFAIAPTHWVICHIPQQHWDNLGACWCQSEPDPAATEMLVIQANQQQAQVFNHLMQRSAANWVYSHTNQMNLLA